MNSYNILRDMFDVNLGFNKLEVQKETDQFDKALIIDQLVDAFPSRFSYDVYSLVNLEYLRSDHVKELINKMSQLLPYETVFGKVVNNEVIVFENIMAFLKTLINIADKASFEGIYNIEKIMEMVEDELSKIYSVEEISYQTLEQLAIEVQKLM